MKRTQKNYVSRAVHTIQGRVLEFGVDLVKLRDMNGGLHSCAVSNFVEEKDGLIHYAAGQLKYVGQEKMDPCTVNLAVQPHIPLEENIHSHVARNYGLTPLAAPAGVVLSTEEGLAVMRTFLTAPDYAVALVWFYVFGSYADTPRFQDVVWVGEPGRSLLYIRQGGREAHIVGLAREYVAFWWGLAGGWGNAPDTYMPLPSNLAFRDFFHYLEPDPRRVRFLSEIATEVWTDDTDKYLLPDESFYELRLKRHSVYFGRMSNELFVLTTGGHDLIPDALPYPHEQVPWDRERRVQVAMEYRVPRASLATVLGLPYF